MGSISSILKQASLLTLFHDLFPVGRGVWLWFTETQRDLVGSSSGRAIARAIA